MNTILPKRILILTADAGFGHRSAANAIAEALAELHPQDCTVEILNPLDHPKTPAVLRESQTDYDRIVRSVPELYKLGYEVSDAPLTSVVMEAALIALLFETMMDILKTHQPDAIVNTYPLYQSVISAVCAIRKCQVPQMTAITDLVTVHRLWFHPRVEYCLVPTEEVRTLALENGMPAERVQLTGIPVHPAILRERRSKAAIRSELGWSPHLITLLVVGSRRVARLPEVLNVFNHSGLPLQFALVAGGDETLHAEWQQTEWHHPAHIYSFVNNMPTLMHAADCIVCKAGGLVVTESLAAGLPLLLVDVLPGQEEGNAAYVEKTSAGELLKDPVHALETLCHWLEQDGALLAEHAANACQAGKPDAAYRAAELAYSLRLTPALPQQERIFSAERARIKDLLQRLGIG